MGFVTSLGEPFGITVVSSTASKLLDVWRASGNVWSALPIGSRSALAGPVAGRSPCLRSDTRPQLIAIKPMQTPPHPHSCWCQVGSEPVGWWTTPSFLGLALRLGIIGQVRTSVCTGSGVLAAAGLLDGIEPLRTSERSSGSARKVSMSSGYPGRWVEDRPGGLRQAWRRAWIWPRSDRTTEREVPRVETG